MKPITKILLLFMFVLMLSLVVVVAQEPEDDPAAPAAPAPAPDPAPEEQIVGPPLPSWDEAGDATTLTKDKKKYIVQPGKLGDGSPITLLYRADGKKVEGYFDNNGNIKLENYPGGLPDGTPLSVDPPEPLPLNFYASTKTPDKIEHFYELHSEKGIIEDKEFVQSYREGETVIYLDSSGEIVGFSPDGGDDQRLYKDGITEKGAPQAFTLKEKLAEPGEAPVPLPSAYDSDVKSIVAHSTKSDEEIQELLADGKITAKELEHIQNFKRLRSRGVSEFASITDGDGNKWEFQADGTFELERGGKVYVSKYNAQTDQLELISIDGEPPAAVKTTREIARKEEGGLLTLQAAIAADLRADEFEKREKVSSARVRELNTDLEKTKKAIESASGAEKKKLEDRKKAIEKLVTVEAKKLEELRKDRQEARADADKKQKEARFLRGELSTGEAIGNFYRASQGWDALSNALLSDFEWAKDMRKTADDIDRWFAGTVLSEDYYESAVCYSDPQDLQRGGAAFIETPTGFFQAVASIQAERIGGEVQILCDPNLDEETRDLEPQICIGDLECRKGFCYEEDKDIPATGFLHRISWGVTAPSDEVLTPYIDENGVAVIFNIEVAGITLYRPDIELKNGASDRDIYPLYTLNNYVGKEACIVWTKPPQTKAIGGGGILGGSIDLNNVCFTIKEAQQGTAGKKPKQRTPTVTSGKAKRVALP